MADDGKKKKRSKTAPSSNLDLKQTKEEIMIAKYLRNKLPPKEGKLAQMVVNIFDGNEAINVLLESKWATGSDKPLLFSNRHYVVEYLKIMLTKNFFHRALKVKKKSRKKIDEKSKKKIAGVSQVDESKPVKESKKKPVKKDGKKARMKLEVHECQDFSPDEPDNDDVYVWIYEPFNPWKFLLGGLVLLVILGFCLFPIWPAQLRSVAYYGSIGCMGVLGLLVALIFLRGLLFGAIWLGSLGRHHLWLLPNLTADCGVMESFRPLYEYENKTKEKTKARVKAKEARAVGNGESVAPSEPGVAMEETRETTTAEDGDLSKEKLE